MKEANKLDPYNTDIQKAAEYNGRMLANLLDIQYVNASKIKSIARAVFILGAVYQKNIIEEKPNIIE